MKRVAKKFKKYIIPHEENEYKPHLLRWRAVGFLCLMIAVAEVAVWFGPSYLAMRSQLFGIVEANALIDGTNANRVTDNMPALKVNALLQAAATEKASDMVKNGYFAHTSPTGVTPWYWFEHVGYDFSYAGENLAVNFNDSQDVTNAWMNSPEHRANILNANYTDIGMAIATGTYEGEPATFVVELFGTPAAAPAPIAVASLPKPQVGAAKPKSTVVVTSSIPSTIPTVAIVTTTPQAVSVAVQGAATEAQPATNSVQSVPAAQVVASPSQNNGAQNNPVQEVIASPRTLSNDFYLLLIAIMVGALVLNILIKIRIQHPQLIFNGVLVIAIAALCMVLNQHQLLAHAMIF